ncbi:hypothetical protein J2S74_000340 [Evansella vedderi]|uniref:Uncharacterized protein n=1 Tax=Evansella vedderi TaxID=38282 RepID=A0ABT9ZR86_9BACI|nr:hypothetical protein [Evansella vedderi]
MWGRFETGEKKEISSFFTCPNGNKSGTSKTKAYSIFPDASGHWAEDAINLIITVSTE